MLTFAQAASACGTSKSTIRRAVKAGRISGTRDDLGVWRVDPAELHRIFPPAAASTAPDSAPLTRHAPPDGAVDALVATLNRVIDDLRQDRDRWREAFENQQRLALPSPKHPETPPATARRLWWPWRRAG